MDLDHNNQSNKNKTKLEQKSSVERNKAEETVTILFKAMRKNDRVAEQSSH